jgi:3-deoxy-7-phosphoheptulonate synthase
MESFEDLITPKEIKEKFPLNEEARVNVATKRGEIEDILDGKSSKKIFIVGPCSVHNYEEAIEYAKKLSQLAEKVKDKVIVLMRTYFEKPRTVVGWKGFVNDPDLNESYDIEKGLKQSRKLLLEINQLGIGVATEFLDLLVYPYLCDLVSWVSIGARTVESPTHRQMASELLAPVGFKNPKSGSIEPAINAIINAKQSHCFLGMDEDGKVSKITTSGNNNTHLVLRGGDTGPNYEKEFVEETQKRLAEKELSENVMIDCSHDNSGRDYKRQPEICKNVVEQMKTNPKVIGLMLEGYLEEGAQKIDEGKKGFSITDGCLGWETTEKLILEGYERL